MRKLQFWAVVAMLVVVILGNQVEIYAQGVLTPSIDNIDDQTAGENAIYKFSFTTTAVIPADGKIRFAFSPGFDVGDASFAFINSGMDGGFFDPVEINQTTLEVTRDGTGTPVTGGTVSIGNIKNTETAGSSNSATITTLTNGGVPIDQGTTPNFTINADELSYFLINRSGNATAGVNYSVQIYAKDQFDNDVTSFNSTVNLEDRTGTISPTTANLNSGQWNGVVQFSQTFTSNKITATFGGKTGTSTAFNVNAGSLSKFLVVPESYSDKEAGEEFLVTVTAQDANDYTVNTFTGKVDIDNENDSISPNESGNFVNGQWTGTVKISTPNSNDKITVTNQAGAETGQSNTFDVVAGALDHFAVAITTGANIEAGESFDIIITAKDAENNTITDNSSDVDISDATGTLSVSSETLSGGTATISDVNITKTKQNNKIYVTGDNKLGESNSFNVIANDLHHFTIGEISSPQVAGSNITIDNITAEDIYDNVVTDFTSPVTISDNTETISPPITGNFSGGQWSGVVIITKSMDDVQITASGGGVNGISNKFNVQPGDIDYLVIRDESGGEGSAVGDLELFINQALILYAAGYDANDNYVHDVEAIWDTTPGSTLDFSGPTSNKKSITFTPITPGTSGRFTADSSGVTGYTTGVINISNDISSIKLNTTPGENGQELKDFQMTVDDTLTLYAAGYDINENYIDLVSINWSVVTKGGNINHTGAEFSFLPEVAPDTVVINGEHGSAGNASTGNIIIKPGKPASQFKLIPDKAKLIADGSDLATITSDTIYDSKGNKITANKLFTISTTPQNLGVTITPVDVNPVIQGHQVSSTNDGVIQFMLTAGTKGGTATISAYSYAGGAYGDTSVAISALRILSITSDYEKVSIGQDSVEVSMLVDNNSSGEINSVTASLDFIGPGSENRNSNYEDIAETITTLPIGETTITFKVNVKDNAIAEDLTIDGQISGFAGADPIEDATADQKFVWKVQEPPEIIIESVQATAEDVDQGASAEVSLFVRNDGEADAEIVNSRIVFEESVSPHDTLKYYVSIPDQDNPEKIMAGAPAVELKYLVKVGASAKPGEVRINGRITVKDVNSDSLYYADDALIKDSWIVNPTSDLQIVEFSPSQSKVTSGQQSPWFVTIKVKNNLESTHLTLDEADIQFVAGLDTITDEFSIIIPTAFFETGNDTLHADSTYTLNYQIVETSSESIGNVQITVKVTLSDEIPSQLTDERNDAQIAIQPESQLVITNVEPIKGGLPSNEVTVGQADEWEVRVDLQNAGESDLHLNFENVRLMIGDNEGYTIQAPENLHNAGNNILTSNTSDYIIFIINSTGEIAGTFPLNVQLEYADENALSIPKTAGDNSSNITVETKPNILMEARSTAPNSQFVNTGQPFQINVIVQNTGDDGVHDLTVGLKTDGSSTIISELTQIIDLAGDSSDTLHFDVEADANSNESEVFTAEIDTAIGDNTSEFDDIIVQNRLATVAIGVQRPANVVIIEIVTPDSIQAFDVWDALVIIKKTGHESVQFDQLHEDNLQFYRNTNLLTGFQVTPPSSFNNHGLKLPGWEEIEADTLKYSIRGGVDAGDIILNCSLPLTYLNEDSQSVIKDSKPIKIKSTAKVVISETKIKNQQGKVDEGIVNISTEQDFGVCATIWNTGQEPITDVHVSVASSDPDSYPATRDSIDSIPAGGESEIEFSYEAHSTKEGTVTFIVTIDSARDSGGKTEIGISTNNEASINVQAKALLFVEFNQADAIMTANATSILRYRVRNLGTAEAGDGQVTFTLPNDFLVLHNSQTYANSFVTDFSTYNTGVTSTDWDTLYIKTPEAPNPTGVLFEVEITDIPVDKNSGDAADTDQHVDTITISTVNSNIGINLEISAPDGAINGILSTYQEFEIKANFDLTDDVKNRVASIILPEGFALKISEIEQKSIPVGVTDTTWKVIAPVEPTESDVDIGVKLAYTINEIEDEKTETIPVTIVERAELEITEFRITEPKENLVKIPVDASLKIRAKISNNGVAGVKGTGKLKLDVGESGIVVFENTERDFNVNVPVVWNAQAPQYPINSASLKLEIIDLPTDENTGKPAKTYLDLREKSFDIEIVQNGDIIINEISVTDEGAIDKIISTQQEFKVRARATWWSSNKPTLEITVPPGFTLLSPELLLVQGPDSENGDGYAEWTVKAPTSESPGNNFYFTAETKDVHSEEPIQYLHPTPLTVDIVNRAKANIKVDVEGQPYATRLSVTIGQQFEITARLTNSGAAGFQGNYTIQMDYPTQLGYTTQNDLNQTKLWNEEARWIFTAPSYEVDFESFNITIYEFPLDENTKQEADQGQNPVSINIKTEEKTVSITNLNLNSIRNNSIAIGQKDVPVFGLQLDVSGFPGSNNVIFSGAKVNLKRRNGSLIPNPHQVISKISVVDYNEHSIVHGVLENIPEVNPIEINFASDYVLSPGADNQILFLVDIVNNTSITDFQLAIDSSNYFIMIDEGSDQPPKFSINGTKTDELHINSDMTVLLNKDFNKAFGNYPNPFNPSSSNPDLTITKFVYYLDQESEVKIEIYTLLGEFVWSTELSREEAGTPGVVQVTSEEHSWNGNNNLGNPVLNGVYIARISTSYGKSAITKVAILQ